MKLKYKEIMNFAKIKKPRFSGLVRRPIKRVYLGKFYL